MNCSKHYLISFLLLLYGVLQSVQLYAEEALKQLKPIKGADMFAYELYINNRETDPDKAYGYAESFLNQLDSLGVK